MTLDPKKIEQWALVADEWADKECSVGGIRLRRELRARWRSVRDAHFASLARADAFEMSAKEARARAEKCGGKAHPVSVGEAVSASIRALAEREKETG